MGRRLEGDEEFEYVKSTAAALLAAEVARVGIKRVENDEDQNIDNLCVRQAHFLACSINENEQKIEDGRGI